MIEITDELYTPSLLRTNATKIFVFGDNLVRHGKGGQAVIRLEPNVFGVVTKRYPDFKDSSFFSDKPEEWFAVEDDLKKLFMLSLTNTIVFPSGGLGTGLSQLKERSPKIWKKLNERLTFYFGFRNPQ